MGARSFRGCIALWLRMLDPHSRVLEGFVQPLLHALVLNDLLQLCLTTTLNVAVGCFDGLTYKQGSTKHAQVGSSVAPLDAVNQVSCRRSTPCASRLARHPSTAQIALGCRLLQRSSTEHPEGSPPRLSGPCRKQQICSAVSGNLSVVYRVGSPAKKSLPPFLDVGA